MGCHLAYLTREDVIILIRMKEIYVIILKNQLSVTVGVELSTYPRLFGFSHVFAKYDRHSLLAVTRTTGTNLSSCV
jgi:hypothetical protein